ncbi:MAG: hypothetical protein ABJB16_03130 [Saprospiraceae bacterium]
MKNLISIVFNAIILFIIFTTCMLSCKKDTFNPDLKQINFQSPAAHQENKYIRYFGFCDYFNPTHDTLLLQVVNLRNNVLQLKETFTTHSPMYTYHPDPVSYEVIWNKNYIITSTDVRTKSNLFFLFLADTIWLNKPASLVLTEDQCRLYQDTIPFEGSAIGRIPSFEAGAEKFLQKQVITQIPTGDTSLLWDQYLVYDNLNIYACYQNIKQGIYVQSPTVSAYTLISK